MWIQITHHKFIRRTKILIVLGMGGVIVILLAIVIFLLWDTKKDAEQYMIGNVLHKNVDPELEEQPVYEYRGPDYWNTYLVNNKGDLLPSVYPAWTNSIPDTLEKSERRVIEVKSDSGVLVKRIAFFLEGEGANEAYYRSDGSIAVLVGYFTTAGGVSTREEMYFDREGFATQFLLYFGYEKVQNHLLTEILYRKNISTPRVDPHLDLQDSVAVLSILNGEGIPKKYVEKEMKYQCVEDRHGGRLDPGIFTEYCLRSQLAETIYYDFDGSVKEKIY